MLSGMESNELAVQQRLASSLQLPAGFAPVLGAAMTIHLGRAAFGMERQSPGGLALVAAGLVAFGFAAVGLLARFRAAHGATVSGLTGPEVFGTSHTSSAVYAAALV